MAINTIRGGEGLREYHRQPTTGNPNKKEIRPSVRIYPNRSTIIPFFLPPMDAIEHVLSYTTRMLDTKIIDELVDRLSSAIPSGLHRFKNELEKNFRRILQSTFSKFDLVTREEFDAQAKVLARTREKLEQLEMTLQKQEANQTKKT